MAEIKSKLKRAGWLMLALLFVATGLGIGVWGFWEFTHPPDETALQESAGCNLGQEPGETLAVPETLKIEADVTRLTTTDLEPGSGATVKSGSCLTVKYHGTLAKSGEKFDGNFDTPLALKLPIGVGQVIPGWDQGLIGMKAGGMRRLVIPSELAYGPNAQQGIPANSDLVFVVKVLSAK